MTDQPEIVWNRALPERERVALVLLSWKHGTTVAHLGADGVLYGCRDVNTGPGHDSCIAAWISVDRERGLRIEDRRP